MYILTAEELLQQASSQYQSFTDLDKVLVLYGRIILNYPTSNEAIISKSKVLKMVTSRELLQKANGLNTRNNDAESALILYKTINLLFPESSDALDAKAEIQKMSSSLLNEQQTGIVKQVSRLDSIPSYKDIEKNEIVYKNVVHKGGFPGIKSDVSLHLCVLREGIIFFNVITHAVQASIMWNQLVNIETSSEMSTTEQAFLTGVAVKSDAFATAITGILLENKALVFYIKQNVADEFIQEIKFYDKRNEEIKSHIMSKRLKLYPEGIRQSTKLSQEIQSDDPITLIRKLASLKEQGILTEEEFNEKKKVLLQKIQ